MTPQDWISISAVVATVVTAGLGLWFAFFTQSRQQKRDDTLRKEEREREDELRRKQQEREDQLRKEQQDREDQLSVIRREQAPRIELEIRCLILGRDNTDYIVEFSLELCNRGLIRQEFQSITLRVRGIEKNQPFVYWPERGKRLEFPIEIISNEEVKPGRIRVYFVEPGVRQIITYVTKIPAHLSYILVHAEFWYTKVALHTAERVFQLTARAEPR